MDYYATLGLKRGASDADIKKAYRSMAMKHHPDRGGDEKTFKEVSQAYECLSDPEKRRIIDMGGDPNSQSRSGGYRSDPFEFHFGTENLNDLFGNFGFGQRPMRRNKSLNIKVLITLEDVLQGKDLNAEISIPGGRNKIINIKIPPGIEHGQQIRYEGMGDASIPDIRAGDLIVNVFVEHHRTFAREGSSLVCEHKISIWEAVLGKELEIRTLDGKTLNIAVPAGTQPETVLSCKGEGLPDMRTKQRGNLLIKFKIEIPRNLSVEQIEKIRELKNGF